MKFRLYIDESGNPDLQNSDNLLHRFLSITGVIVDLDYVAKVLAPELETLKRKHFDYHPDDPVVLHRKELVNQKYPFESLADPKKEAEFNKDLLQILERIDYKVISVVIDKKLQRDLYKVWHYDPYHYCLAVTLERYIHFLESNGCRGDAMAESRGGKEDLRLKRSYETLFEQGTEFVSPERFQYAFTSRQLKVKPKQNNIAGLQVADLVAHPSQRHILRHYSIVVDNRATFGDKIAGILVKDKYYRSSAGVIEGYGIKLLP